jgi:hypothetical protein
MLLSDLEQVRPAVLGKGQACKVTLKDLEGQVAEETSCSEGFEE